MSKVRPARATSDAGARFAGLPSAAALVGVVVLALVGLGALGGVAEAVPTPPSIDIQTDCNGPFGSFDIEVVNPSSDPEDITVDVTTPAATHLTHVFVAVPSGALSPAYHRSSAADGAYSVTATSSDPNEAPGSSSFSLSCAGNAGSGSAVGTGTRNCTTGLVTGTVTATDIVEPATAGGGPFNGPMNLVAAHTVISSGNAADGSLTLGYSFTPDTAATSFGLDLVSGISEYVDIPITVQLAACSSPSSSAGPASTTAASSAAGSNASHTTTPTSAAAATSTALATTGVDRDAGLALGGALLVGGCLLVLVARRRQATARH